MQYVLHRFVRAQQLLPLRTGRLAPVVRVNQRVMPEVGLVEEDEPAGPSPGVLPQLVGPRRAALRPTVDLVRLAIPDEDPATVGAPARHLRRPAFAEAPVGIRDPRIERR